MDWLTETDVARLPRTWIHAEMSYIRTRKISSGWSRLADVPDVILHNYFVLLEELERRNYTQEWSLFDDLEDCIA
jgi:hypothetical protein